MAYIYIVLADIVPAYIVMASSSKVPARMIYTGVACIVMAYIVMAYVVMAYVVMAYIVMAYIVMAHVVMAYIVMSASVELSPSALASSLNVLPATMTCSAVA